MSGPVSLVVLFGAAAVASASTAPTPEDVAIYRRCAVCHLSDGAGVPGTYPPLDAHVRDLARTNEGRRYLVLVVAKGAAGAITVAGKTYRGVMPSQAGLGDGEIAAVLNHVVGVLAKGGDVPLAFTAREVEEARQSGGGLAPADVVALRRKLLEP